MKQIFILLLLVCFIPQLQAQEAEKPIKKCKAKSKKVKYKLIFDSRTLRGELLSFIYVEAKNINKEFMLKLAKQLKAEYCNEKKEVQFVIFDKKEHVDKYLDFDLAISAIKSGTPFERGYYLFNRESGEESMEFSRKSRSPTTEVQIALSNYKLGRSGSKTEEIKKNNSEEIKESGVICIIMEE